MTKTAKKTPEPTDPELLLPWYATGQLSEAETALVEDWLAENEDARAHLERSREELDLTVRDSESLGAPRAGALSALMARVAEEKPATLAVSSWADRIAAFFTPRMLAAAAAVVVVIFGAQMATIGVLLQRDAATYETVSTPETPLPEGTVALMAFQPTATIEEVSGLLSGAGAIMIGGPDAAGLYRVLIPDGDGVAAALEALSTSDLVRFFSETQ